MKKILFPVFLLFAIQQGYSQEVDSVQLFFDNVEANLDYQQGKIELPMALDPSMCPKTSGF